MMDLSAGKTTRKTKNERGISEFKKRTTQVKAIQMGYSLSLGYSNVLLASPAISCTNFGTA